MKNTQTSMYHDRTILRTLHKQCQLLTANVMSLSFCAISGSNVFLYLLKYFPFTMLSKQPSTHSFRVGLFQFSQLVQLTNYNLLQIYYVTPYCTKQKLKQKTKEKYQNQATKLMIHKYILKIYTPTLANTLKNQQTYLTFWM